MEMIVPFLDDSHEFCHGVEVGLLYAKMRDQDDKIEGTYHRANDEQIFLMAQRMGYSFEWRAVDDTWFEAAFARESAPGGEQR